MPITNPKIKLELALFRINNPKSKFDMTVVCDKFKSFINELRAQLSDDVIAKMLWEISEDPSLAYAMGSLGLKPLHILVDINDIPLVSKVVQLGVDAQAKDSIGWT